ncbi:phage tail protein [Aliikangiella sp. IMCC44359]|uniref:phage tail protein n=1 Tax=Aliikangiella sp. IMCC44359 TaxID=3459125 RepID=UPI00403A88BC
MSEPYIGQIKLIGFNFAPRGWAFCDGQLLSVSQNDALFSLLGTFYGGDGRTTFGLPDFRGRLPVHQGQGPGLSNRPIGQRTGVEDVTLRVNQIPPHNHPMQASKNPATSPMPSGEMLANLDPTLYYVAPDSTNQTELLPEAVQNAGANSAHTNLMPSMALNFVIALHGIYPSRQ